ncbi:hypothetical protein [Haloferax marisrubri]|uniref:Histidine kinase N-terminal 7TM region domain-containing protein n=1 Tax=Haloferax marisrubri TaxID=1544719 RepID=A0A2P4NKV2_9EURY|nr:hypothetical protein [Haloferax marisrubri]POG53765.1 hypothetical protein AUR65_018495 [Haloferax marisrubri]
MTAVERRTQRLLGYVAVAGAVGWGGTYLVDELSTLSIAQDIYLVVVGWAVLLAAGALPRLTTPVMRRTRAWRVWLVVSAVALAVNAVANTPSLVPDPALFTLAQDYAYYHPWFAVYAVGYIATARYEPKSKLVGSAERTVYLASGALSLAVLVGLFALSPPDEYVLLAGGLLNVVPPLAAIAVRRRER